MSRLDFHAPDHERFPCLGLAFRALRAGGTAPAVLNAANEVVVDAFLNGRLSFHEIPQLIEAVLDSHQAEPAGSLDGILKADGWAREETGRLAGHLTLGKG